MTGQGLPAVISPEAAGQEAGPVAQGKPAGPTAHRFVPDADPYCRLCGLPYANRCHDYTPRHRAAA